MTAGRSALHAVALVIALDVVASVGAIALLERMAPAIDRILRDNELSLDAARRMSVALAGDRVTEANRAEFAEALAAATSNVTEGAERPILAELAEVGPRALDGDRTARAQTRRLLHALARINRHAMAEADRDAQRLGRSGAVAVAMLGLAALAVGVLAIARLRRRLGAPLHELSFVLSERGRGDRHRRCRAERGGDLAGILASVNDLLDSLDRTEAADDRPLSGILNQVLDTLAAPTLIVDAKGRAMASSRTALERYDTDSDARDRVLAAVGGGDDAVAGVIARRLDGPDVWLVTLDAAAFPPTTGPTAR